MNVVEKKNLKLKDQFELDKKTNSKHMTKLLIVEFGYCFLIFFIHTLGKTNYFMNSKYIFIYFGLLVILPLIFNTIKYFHHRRKLEFQKASNYLITQIILIMLAGYFLKK